MRWLRRCLGGRPTTTHQEVLAMSESERPVVIYWRPGCGFCARLRSTLGAEGDKAVWVDIWRDEEGAAFVRSVNDGNETVPTVVIGGTSHTNPDPALVRERLAEV
jgi:mycoredoxin